METFFKTDDKATKRRIHSIKHKVALKFGSKTWVLKKRNDEGMEASQMKYLKHMLGISKLDRERNQPVSDKLGTQNAIREAERYQRRCLR